jgi:hypothetical protein
MEIEELDLVEESAPSEDEKESAHGIRAGNVGAPATPGIMDPTVGREEEENLWIMVRTWTNRNLIRKLLGTSWS